MCGCLHRVLCGNCNRDVNSFTTVLMGAGLPLEMQFATNLFVAARVSGTPSGSIYTSLVQEKGGLFIFDTLCDVIRSVL